MMTPAAELVLRTTYASVLAQCLTGLYGIYGLFQRVAPADYSIYAALAIEMFVQAIQFTFYLVFITRFDLSTMALTRYQDWFITTPLMLISASIYYHYEKLRAEGRDTTDALRTFWTEHRQAVVVIVLANLVMIAFGYAGEIGILSRASGTVWGFVAFAVAFYTLWTRLASHSTPGRWLFSLIASVWTLYGIAYLFGTVAKNIIFNGLDIVAKNFFGAYLAYKVIQAAGGADLRAQPQARRDRGPQEILVDAEQKARDAEG
jgi:bacteriorhodopsin